MSIKNSLQVASPDLNQIQAIGEYGINEIMAMKETIGKDLSIPQFNLFMYDCNRLSLDPRLKHAFPILYGGKMDFRISFEGYHAMAQKSEGYIGLKMEVVCENETEDFLVETDEDGDITKITHKIKFPRGKVVGSYAIAKREGKKNLIILCDKSEFEKYAKKNGQFWKLEDGGLDPDMCKKHAGFRAIKGQFAVAAVAEDLTEEMNAALNGPVSEPPQRKDITAEAEQMSAGQQQELGGKSDDHEAKLQQARQQMAEKFEVLGIREKKEIGEYIAKHAKPKGDKPTLAEMLGLLKIMDMHIEEKKARDAAGSDLDDELAAELDL